MHRTFRISAAVLLVCAWTTAVHAATKVQLHSTSSSVAGYKSADSILGSGVTTSVTTETTNGGPIQWTATAGGSAIKWISEPLVSGVTISGTISFNVWDEEANANNNSNVGFIVKRYTAGAESTTISTCYRGTEIVGTTIAADAWTTASGGYTACSVTSTVLSAGDRIVIIGNIDGCSGACTAHEAVMGTGSVTVDYAGATGAADGDTYVSFNETINFQQVGVPATQTVTLVSDAVGVTHQAVTDVATQTVTLVSETVTGAAAVNKNAALTEDVSGTFICCVLAIPTLNLATQNVALVSDGVVATKSLAQVGNITENDPLVSAAPTTRVDWNLALSTSVPLVADDCSHGTASVGAANETLTTGNCVTGIPTMAFATQNVALVSDGVTGTQTVAAANEHGDATESIALVADAIAIGVERNIAETVQTGDCLAFESDILGTTEDVSSSFSAAVAATMGARADLTENLTTTFSLGAGIAFFVPIAETVPAVVALVDAQPPLVRNLTDAVTTAATVGTSAGRVGNLAVNISSITDTAATGQIRELTQSVPLSAETLAVSSGRDAAISESLTIAAVASENWGQRVNVTASVPLVSDAASKQVDWVARATEPHPLISSAPGAQAQLHVAPLAINTVTDGATGRLAANASVTEASSAISAEATALSLHPQRIDDVVPLVSVSVGAVLVAQASLPESLSTTDQVGHSSFYSAGARVALTTSDSADATVRAAGTTRSRIIVIQ